jgi:hypothetical protein
LLRRLNFFEQKNRGGRRNFNAQRLDPSRMYRASSQHELF